MFIAHIPAGYLLTTVLLRRTKKYPRALFWTSLFFSIAPDLDLVWFYFGSNRLVPHHAYVTHWPFFWIVFSLCALFFAHITHRMHWREFIHTGFLNILLHLVLDSVAAEVYWLAPAVFIPFNLVEVPSVNAWWVWNFVFHWTFGVELIICCVAGFVLLQKHRRVTRT